MEREGTTPQLTDIATKNDAFPIGIQFSRGLFSGAFAVSFREGKTTTIF